MSLWVDVEMGRPIEVEVIVGAVVRLAKQIGVKTPLLNYTYALMKGLQVEILEQQEAKREAARKTVTA
jgi:2-dehydropantoate 2-reductase